MGSLVLRPGDSLTILKMALTPADVSRAEQLTTARRQILLEAHRTHPERFVRGTPQPPVLPPQAWINPPTEKTTLLNAAQASFIRLVSSTNVTQATGR